MMIIMAIIIQDVYTSVKYIILYNTVDVCTNHLFIAINVSQPNKFERLCRTITNFVTSCPASVIEYICPFAFCAYLQFDTRSDEHVNGKNIFYSLSIYILNQLKNFQVVLCVLYVFFKV